MEGGGVVSRVGPASVFIRIAKVTRLRRVSKVNARGGPSRCGLHTVAFQIRKLIDENQDNCGVRSATDTEFWFTRVSGRSGPRFLKTDFNYLIHISFITTILDMASGSAYSPPKTLLCWLSWRATLGGTEVGMAGFDDSVLTWSVGATQFCFGIKGKRELRFKLEKSGQTAARYDLPPGWPQLYMITRFAENF